MERVDNNFKARVYALVTQIPKGRVMTYGQIAALCGNPLAARIVGGIAHFGDPSLPWQRVVNKNGGLASGYPGGKNGHKTALEAEGVIVYDDYQISIEKLLWWPKGSTTLTHNLTPETSPLVVILGPTASGKTALAMEIAKRFNGEIICADSRTIYKYMNIGTAKPTNKEQSGVRHYGLDLINPDKAYSAAQFKEMALKAIDDITNRGKLPIMVGGTGLYIDGVLFDYQFLPLSDPGERKRLNNLSVEQLQAEIIEKELLMPANSQNPRHLTRAIETNGAIPKKGKLRPNTCVIGIQTDLQILKDRITKRMEEIIKQGFIKEVTDLSKQYGWDAQGLQAPGYKAFRDFVEGKKTLDEAKAQFVRNDYLLAKRQRTWFKRNKSIQWVNNKAEAVDIITTHLNK